jgi:hypothetical protein
MRGYVKDVVTATRADARVPGRRSPALWGWEFGNEFNLGADLPNASERRPAAVPRLGTPAHRSEKDQWSYETIRTAFAAFAREVRRFDPDRVISTGDALPRSSAWHNRKEKTWANDTAEQFAAMLTDDNPDPVDLISVHAYGDAAREIRDATAVAARVRKPLFVGEFGAPGPAEKSEKEFRALLSTIEAAQVPLAALWVYDFKAQDGAWNVTAVGDRAYQLRAISAANARIRAVSGATEPGRRGPRNDASAARGGSAPPGGTGQDAVYDLREQAAPMQRRAAAAQRGPVHRRSPRARCPGLHAERGHGGVPL